MDAAESPSPSPLSKKQLHSPDPSKRRGSDPDLAVKTPGKSPRMSRRRGAAAMSIREVREAAMRLRERKPDPSVRVESELVAKPAKSSSGCVEIRLPEKYELLDKFFNSLDCSIRLLQLKRYSPTFTDISSQIETLTDRRFTYGHLAQLKFIMPEAIMLEKILRHDERTSCMKPDLRITLSAEEIETKSKSKSLPENLHLRKVFRARLLDFFKSHPECEEVPEGALPEPFGRVKEDASASSTQPSTSSLTSDVALLGMPFMVSHLPQSFKKHFSQKASSHNTENLNQDQSVVAVHDSIVSEDKFPGSPSPKQTSEVASESQSKCSSYKTSSPGSMLSSSFLETPVKCIDSTSVLRTPVDMASTPAKLMIATPMIQTPKRCNMSPDDNSSKLPSKLVRRPPPKRPLKFDTPVKNVKVENDDDYGRSRISSTDDDIFDILPDALLQSICEKERLATMERDPAISQAKWRRHMIASLPKTFDKISFFFHSIGRSVVTKQELIQKLIGHLDIVDRREVEEQLRLLQEFVPEWIYEKSAASGDILFCVNKISSPEAIRTRLSEAK